MKSILIYRLWLIFLVVSLFMSCKRDHEIRKSDFHIPTSTLYRVSPTHPVQLSINDSDYVGFAYFPGGGEGNASHITKLINNQALKVRGIKKRLLKLCDSL